MCDCVHARMLLLHDDDGVSMIACRCAWLDSMDRDRVGIGDDTQLYVHAGLQGHVMV